MILNEQMNDLKDELEAITQEATVWKQKMEEIEQDLKLANERG